MVPVLMLCIGVFAVNAGFHLLATLGVLQALSSSIAYGLFGVALLGFVAAILTHPRSESHGGHTKLGLWQCFQPLHPATRAAYGALLIYGMIATMASAPMKSGGRSVPLTELLDAPYFLTAFLLVFSTCALAASHSALLIHKHPFGFNQP